MKHFRPATGLLFCAALLAGLPALAAPQAPLFPPETLPPGQADVEAGEKARNAKQYPAALAAFGKAADLNNTDALVDLAEMHEKGWGVAKDCAKAAALYEKAAKLGDPYAKYKVKCDLVGSEAKWKAQVAKAEAGDAVAGRLVGDAYFFGAMLVEQDEKAAAKWYEKAAAKGDAQAMCNLGLMSEYGFGVKQDDPAAMKWYEKAEAAGSAEATCRIGFMHLCGSGVEVSLDKAADFFRKSADAGCAQGMRALALCYREGMGVGQDEGQGKRLWEQAQKMDGDRKIFVRVSLYGGDVKGFPGSKPKEVGAWLEAQVKAGNVGAMHVLGQELSGGTSYGLARDFPRSVALLSKAAKGGRANAMNTLGICVSHHRELHGTWGWGLADAKAAFLLWTMGIRQKEDAGSAGMNRVMTANLAHLALSKAGLPLSFEHALRWGALDSGENMAHEGVRYRHGWHFLLEDPEVFDACAIAARWGDAQAMVDLGAAYDAGRGVPKDPARARALFARAVAKDPRVAGALGERYSLGMDAPRDDKQAALWLARGAAAGDWRSMRLLGVAYHRGEGVPKDEKQAVAWYDKVAVLPKRMLTEKEQQAYRDEVGQVAALYGVGLDAPFDLAKAAKRRDYCYIPHQHYWEAFTSHRGRGVAVDLAKAEQKYREANGCTAQLMQASEMAYKGQGPGGMNRKEAFFQFSRQSAMDSGYLSPLFTHDHAFILLNGMGCDRDSAQAADLFLRSAFVGNDVSAQSLGLMFNDEHGSLEAERAQWAKLLAAASAGDADAMMRLGRMCWLGQGCPINREQAAQWFFRAVAAGNREAVCQLGSLCAARIMGDWRGLGRDLALPYFQKAAALGSPRAMFCLGYAHEHGLGTAADLAKSVEWYAKSAAAGDTFAMIAIAELARNGGAGAVDTAKALRWYAAAADKDNLLAMRVLADSFRLGEWTGQDEKAAFGWYEKAAAKNDPEAMFRLGLALRTGKGAEVDEAKGAAWYEKAAKLGHSGAMRNLGMACRDGKGVKEDAKAAWMWFELAARDQAKNAEGYRDAVAEGWSEAQLKDAKAAADALGKTIWPDR